MERRLCTVDRPSDRDHLFTEEGEGCEEPFERDGTTRRSRGRLLRGRSRCPWAVSNVPRPGQTQNNEKKLGKKEADPVKNKRIERRLCTVDRPSDRDHLFMEEGEGCEEPLERDGTTRQSRGKKWHVGRSPVRAARGLGTRL
ncbi:hypothetical protein CDL15_Pgr027120 [Punica granatum]|uniref:Uncharacterized protein n=1 Tax=Punica granatum TaxID=22663 RepID=A0A218WYR0_PUNGR|nr:hypothetical protein CDL15_Pgr027120 [Punica granatum]